MKAAKMDITRMSSQMMMTVTTLCSLLCGTNGLVLSSDNFVLRIR